MRKLDTTWNHRKHAQNIKEAWMRKAQEKGIILSRFLNEDILHSLDPKEIMLSTTGSDGRFENKAHPWVRSNLELQLVTATETSPEKIEWFVKQIRDLVGFNLETIEIKRMWTDKLSIYNNNPDLVFPTRFFDSVAFFDPAGIRSRLLMGISDEVMTDGKLSSKMYDRFRVHRKIMETGSDKFHWIEYKSYDLDQWIFHYDPENYIFWVKNGPLRYVQYMLATWLMRYIRDSKRHPIFIDELPTSIIERLAFIQGNALSSKNSTELDRLIEIYEFFLHLYHEMQYRHFSEWETNFIIEDLDALRDIRDMLACLRDAYKIEQFYPVNK